MSRLQFVAVLGALALLLIVLELVRRRRLLERYALLWLAVGVGIGLALSAVGWFWPKSSTAPRISSMAAYLVSGTVAGLVAWKRALLGRGAPVWEPTPRALGGGAPR